LTENSRLFVLNEIYQQYKNLMNSSNGIKKVTIVTTFKLENKDLKNLIKKLEAKYETKFEPEIIIDPYLIGGVRIEIDDQVLDGSVRSRIDRLKSSLLT
jgi:F-type H+-transporting ATPase subunit delta